jgi:hypothetical protein
MAYPGLSYIFAYETSHYKLKAPVATDPDDVCLFCREPYKRYRGDPEGCTPTRLSSCGHVIGLECLQTWLVTHQDQCPYYNHPIPRKIVYNMHTDPKTLYEKLLAWILFSRLGRYWDRKLTDIVRMMPGTYDPFCALMVGRMNDRQLKEMEHAFYLALGDSVLLNPTLTFLLMTFWVLLGSIWISLSSQQLVISPNAFREPHGGISAFLVAGDQPNPHLAALQDSIWVYYPVVALVLFQIIWFSHLGLLWLVVRSLLRFARSTSGLARSLPSEPHVTYYYT